MELSYKKSLLCFFWTKMGDLTGKEVLGRFPIRSLVAEYSPKT